VETTTETMETKAFRGKRRLSHRHQMEVWRAPPWPFSMETERIRGSSHKSLPFIEWSIKNLLRCGMLTLVLHWLSLS
jgi:hypothetical protein